MVVRLVPDTPSSDLPDIERFKQWKPEYQQRALELLKEREAKPWTAFYCKNHECNGQPHVWPADTRDCPYRYGHVWLKDSTWFCEHCGVGGHPLDEWLFPHARLDQRPPPWGADWLYWWLSGGRGSGKTRTGSEVTNRVSNQTPRIILIAPTGPDLRETMVEGRSGILATAPPDNRPLWEPSKKKLTWPNGCIGQGFSAEEPDRLRGPESGFIWADEPAHYPFAEAVWDNMLFGFRVKGKPGFKPKIVATSTPKSTKWLKAQFKDALSYITRVSSYANISNLDDVYKKVIIPKYEGTRTGQQELEGELLEDVEGALWHWEMFQWVKDVPVSLTRIVVAVDPAGTKNKRSDETGIVVLGIGTDKRIYVLGDYSGKYSPNGWASKVIQLTIDFSADAIVAEKNYGGDMVETTIQNSADKRRELVRIKMVTSRRGKEIRAEPIVALYEKMKVVHVGERGLLAQLEEEQTTWVPGVGDSPNRVDALVHGATDLAKQAMPVEVANPQEVLRDHRRGHLRVVS
jgi:phage terminase large subunit-like protein